jgi:hypothetical protein
LDIFLLGRHGWHVVKKNKFSHHLEKFESHALSNRQKEGQAMEAPTTRHFRVEKVAPVLENSTTLKMVKMNFYRR